MVGSQSLMQNMPPPTKLLPCKRVARHYKRDHLLVPLDGLNVGGVVAGRKASRVHKTPKRVASEISSVGIKLATQIARSETNTRLIDVAGDLDVRRRLHELHRTPVSTWLRRRY